MRASLHPTTLIATALALVLLFGCGDDGNDQDPVTVPCGGACPANQCFGNMCFGGNNGANNGENNGVNNGENNGVNNGANNGMNNGANNGVNNGDPDAGDAGDTSDADDAGDADDTGDAGDVPDADDAGDMGEDTADVPEDVPNMNVLCDRDRDCEDDEICNDDGVCVLGCEADAEEANDLPGDANDLGLDTDQSVTLEALTLCGDDEDWFYVEAEVGDTVEATVTQPDGEIVPVAIYDDDGATELVLADDRGETRSVSFEADDNAGYYVKVGPLDDPGRTGMTYTLTVSRGAPGVCLPDAHEPNNTIGDATRIGAGIVEGRICREESDIDYFEIGLLAGDQVDLTLTYDHDAGTLPATIYGPGGLNDARDFFLVGNGDDETPSGGTLTIGNGDAGDWLIGIEADEAGAPIEYDLEVALTRDDPNCETPDLNEPNETCGQATTLTPFVDVDGYVCGPGGDVDWFKVAVGQGNDLTIRVEHFHFDGNIELEVYDENDTLVGFSFNSGENFEEVALDNPGAGEYCARVYVRSSIVENDYTIEASVQ